MTENFNEINLNFLTSEQPFVLEFMNEFSMAFGDFNMDDIE
jgi:hypothetical protein